MPRNSDCGHGIAVVLCAELLPLRAYTPSDGLAVDRIDGGVVDSRCFPRFVAVRRLPHPQFWRCGGT
jgi:hypothetical protein